MFLSLQVFAFEGQNVAFTVKCCLLDSYHEQHVCPPTFFFGDAVALLRRESCTKFCHIHSVEVADILFYCHFEAKTIKCTKT